MGSLAAQASNKALWICSIFKHFLINEKQKPRKRNQPRAQATKRAESLVPTVLQMVSQVLLVAQCPIFRRGTQKQTDLHHTPAAYTPLLSCRSSELKALSLQKGHFPSQVLPFESKGQGDTRSGAPTCLAPTLGLITLLCARCCADTRQPLPHCEANAKGTAH